MKRVIRFIEGCMYWPPFGKPYAEVDTEKSRIRIPQVRNIGFDDAGNIVRVESPQFVFVQVKPEEELGNRLLEYKAVDDSPTDSQILDWLQDMHTLHYTVETLYVVDGYEVEIMYDGSRTSASAKAETLREAYVALMTWRFNPETRRIQKT